MVMEKAWNKIGKISCNQISPLHFTKSLHFFAKIKKFVTSLESLHFLPFSAKCCECREIVMDHQEIVMEKSLDIFGGAKSMGTLK